MAYEPLDPTTRVCARCGRPASDKDVCTCGANLAAMRGMLPTLAEWEAANPDPVPTVEEPPVGKPARTLPRPQLPRPQLPRLRLPKLRRPGRTGADGARTGRPSMRTQIIASVVIAGVFITMVLVANGSNKARTDTTTLPASTTTTPTGSTPASSTATTASTTASASSTATAVGLPSVASCVAAWNGGKSATHRHVLDLRVQQDPARAAVIASYRGRNALLARDGGGSQVALTSGVCIVIAHHSVFVQQPNHNWGLVKAAAPYPFAAIVTTPHWAATRANATITVGPLGSPSANAGAVTARGGQLVVLSTSDLGNPAG